MSHQSERPDILPSVLGSIALIVLAIALAYTIVGVQEWLNR